MHNRRRTSGQAIYSMAWDAMGSVRASRDRLPYSTQLLTYLLSENSGATREAFHLGQWLATLDVDSLAHLCELGYRIAHPVSEPADLEARADLVLLLEMTLFEEHASDLQMHVSPDGGVPLLKHIGLCAGLECLRRNRWAAINFISINVEHVQAMLTPAGQQAKMDVFCPCLLQTFDWIEQRAKITGEHRH